ncbi:MAG: efflux RND transporter periplasmic adaptor subunit [Verrucomicrobiota bacterium]|nr:efflux RND transporter periplasmic adaptor subunit [Verrucomicrobiota bacterium]
MQATTTHATSAPPPVPEKKRARAAIFKVVAGLIIVFLVIAGIKGFQFASMIKAGKAMVPPATTVTSAKVQNGNWVPMLTAVGSISPVQGAMIGAELAGTVSAVDFQSGTPVQNGEVLIKLDASAELAQLRSAQADADLAKNDYDRAKDLAARKVISKAELDAAESKYAQKKAAVDNIQSIIDKKQIHAPFAGTAGIRQVNVGQQVKAGDPLVSLQTLDKVFVDFSLPQQQLSEVKVGLPVKVTTDAIKGREFDGKVTAINSAIDTATRSVSMQATLDNDDHVLRAGMFAHVSVVLPETNPTLFIPLTSVLYAPFGNSVYLIEKKKDEKTGKEELVLRQQFIRTGETRGDFVAVTDGLKEGETIASTGVFKLRNGSDVVIDNKLAPDAQISPTPPNS